MFILNTKPQVLNLKMTKMKIFSPVNYRHEDCNNIVRWMDAWKMKKMQRNFPPEAIHVFMWAI